MNVARVTQHFRKPAFCFLGALLVFAAGCALFGGGGEESLVRAKGFTASEPTDWQEVDADDESDRAFRLKSGNLVTLTSSCGRAAANSLEVLTRSLLLGTRKVRYLKKERLTIQGEEALHSSIQATLEGKPFRLEVVVLKKNGCVFDFSLMSPHEVGETDQTEFLNFVKSFQYGKD